MNLSSRVRVLIVLIIFALVLANTSQASEEKPASLEAILEELSALRAIVENQQRLETMVVQQLAAQFRGPMVGQQPSRHEQPKTSAGTQQAQGALDEQLILIGVAT